jgi:hypothetical protein
MKVVNKEPKGQKNVLEKLAPYAGYGVLIFLTFSLLGSISRMRDVGSQIDREKDKVDKVKQESEELHKNLEIVKSEEFIEKQLRDNLGLAKEGEIVVILPDTEMVKKFAPRQDEEEEVVLSPNWKKWMHLFGF